MSDDNVIRLFGGPVEEREAAERAEVQSRVREALIAMLDNLKTQVEKGQIGSIVSSIVYVNGAPGHLMVVGSGGVLSQLGSLRVAEAKLIAYARDADEIS